MFVRKWEKQTVRIGGQLLKDLQKLERQTLRLSPTAPTQEA